MAPVIQQDVPLELRAIGNVEAHSSVAVKSRVAGMIKSVRFTEGQDVKKGDLLFEIDAAPFEENLRLAEANLLKDVALEKQAEAQAARDRVTAKNARQQATRYEELQKQGIISRDQADQLRTVAEAAEASLAANVANIESARASARADESRINQARIQLSYTKIYAPISGRTGVINVKEGNLVKENDTVSLVDILQVQPVYVSFAVPEQTLSDIRRFRTAGQLTVMAAPDGTQDSPTAGRLDFIDNAVDTQTGTIRLKATFPNTDRKLWPGQFANATLRLTVERGQVTVPSAAVQTGPNGTYVWRVKQDQTAEMQLVKVLRTQGDVSILLQGLQPGETVIVEGQLRVAPGAKLQILQNRSKL
ncbi:MAG: efflux RND transporter periplasmic adaptor subunit [Bryobacterales bacterium]|nr:efflux RND transporter periplasmic adaptor subunit [Bryobacterales bacterium]